ncbi:hypothetical protein Tco_0642393 [Tanacetum coccineum]
MVTTRRNSDDDVPNFEAMITAAVANALPNLTAALRTPYPYDRDLCEERFAEIHKFCDATLRRTLEGLKSYYNDVKYGYVQKELTNDEVEFLKLFEEEIEVRLNYRDQMRRWEMYVNGRPLGPRRERPE